jgi:hypothetical protein
MTQVQAAAPWNDVVLWGLIASVLMDIILEAAQGLGFSRMSLPFLFGTFFTSNRSWAVIVGFATYLIGGWVFAFLYFLLFRSLNIYTWWFGMLAGAVHGLFLLATMLPLMPFVHPRMASEYHGATLRRQLEPPGFLAINYGRSTPLWTFIAQAVYGGTLGGLAQLHQSVA